MQYDGNLVGYGVPIPEYTSVLDCTTNSPCVWASKSAQDNHGENYSLLMQGDGNLCIYRDGQLTPIWQTATNGSAASQLSIKAGVPLLLDKAGKTIWSP
jgi:hypothetical protein